MGLETGVALEDGGVASTVTAALAVIITGGMSWAGRGEVDVKTGERRSDWGRIGPAAGAGCFATGGGEGDSSR